MAGMYESSQVAPLDRKGPEIYRSRLATFACFLATAPPVLAFVSMLLGAGWGSVNWITSIFLRIMLLSVPTSLVLGIMAIVRIRGEPQLSGTGLGVCAVLVSGGVIGAVVLAFSQWEAHY
mgnify:CR=1 FL=1